MGMYLVLRFRKFCFSTLVFWFVVSCKPSQLEFKTLPLGGDIELTGMSGAKQNIYSELKKANILFFGFTHCPDFCPTILQKIDRALQFDTAINPNQFSLIFISVDCKHDSPEKIKQYLARFKYARGFSADCETLPRVEKLFGAYSKIETKSISHSLYLYLINDRGETQYLFRHDDPTEKIAAGVKQLLAQ